MAAERRWSWPTAGLTRRGRRQARIVEHLRGRLRPAKQRSRPPTPEATNSEILNGTTVVARRWGLPPQVLIVSPCPSATVYGVNPP